MTDLAALVVRMQADNSQYVKALEQSTSALKKFQKDQEDGLDELKKHFAEAFAIEKLVEFGDAAIEAAAGLEKLAAMSGVSVESLSGLSAAFAGSGVDTEALGGAFKKLNVAIEEAAGNPTSKAGAAFRTLGINIKDANGNVKDSGAILAEVADKFSQTADGANKTALAVALFGRNGTLMIPTLDKGSAALEEASHQLDEWGLKLSGPQAAAAEEFRGKIELLSSSLTAKLGGELATALLPVLESLIKAFADSGVAATSVKVIIDATADTLRLAAAAIVIVSGELIALGHAALGLGQAFYDLNTFNWKKVGTDLKEGFGKAFDDTKATVQATRDVLQAGTDDALDYIDQVAILKQKIEEPPKNLAATEAADAAIKKLTEYNNQLKDQAGAFGLGSAALTNYKLQFGPLADAIKDAGDAGTKLAASIRENAAALQKKEDTKSIEEATKKMQEQIDTLKSGSLAAYRYEISQGALGEALARMGGAAGAAAQNLLKVKAAQIAGKDAEEVQAINDKLETMNGKLVAAAGHAFDLQHALLTKDLGAAGDTAGLAKVQALKDAEIAQAAFNEQEKKAAEYELAYATAEAKTNAQLELHQITELQAQAQLSDARRAELAQLEQVYQAEKKIADGSGLPELIANYQKLGNTITSLGPTVNTLANQVTDKLETSFADAFAKVMDGSESAKKAFLDFGKSIISMVDQMVAKNIAQSIFGGGSGGSGGGPLSGAGGLLAGLFGSGGGSGGLGGFMSLFGGGVTGAGGALGLSGGGGTASLISDADLAALPGLAAGGTIPAGGMALVGESGPEFAYAGSNNMNIIPPEKMGKKQTINNHFTIQAPGGTISRASQSQTAATVARSLQAASMRNNR